MKKLAYYSDLVFCFFAVGLFALCYLRYLKLPLIAALFSALLLGGAAALLLSTLLKRKQDAVFLKKREAEEAEKLALHLALLSKQELAEFFQNALHAKTYLKDGECFGKFEEDTLLFKKTPTPLTAESVLPLLYESGEGSASLYCAAICEEGELFCKRFGVKTVKLPELFQRLQRENALPDAYKSERAFLRQRRRSLSLRFSKRSAPRFLTGGAMLLVFSLITPFPYYYLLVGGGLVVAALFVRIFGNA